MSDAAAAYDSEISQLIGTRQFEKAYELSIKALGDFPNDYMFLKYQGNAALELADIKKDEKEKYLEDALKCLNQSVKEQPTENEDAFILLADIYATKGNIEEAKKHAQVAIDAKFQLLNAYFILGRAYQQNKDWINAIKHYEIIVSNKAADDNAKEEDKFPNWYQLYLNVGICYQNNGDSKLFPQGIKFLEEAKKLKKNEAAAYISLNQMWQKLDNFKKAEEVFADAPDTEQILLAKGDLFRTNGDYVKALECYEKVTQLNENSQEAQLKKADLSYYQSKWDDAISGYQKVLDKNPDNLNAKHNQAVAILNKGDLKRAIQLLEEVVAKDKNFVEAYINLGNTYDKLNDVQNAEKNYKAAIGLKEGSKEIAGAYNGLGIVLLKGNKTQEAEEQFENAIKADKEYVLAYANKASAMIKANHNQAEALVLLKKADELLHQDHVVKQLSKGVVTFIESGIKQILQLEEQFGEQARFIEQSIKELEQANATPQEIEKLKVDLSNMVGAKNQSQTNNFNALNSKDTTSSTQGMSSEMQKQFEFMKSQIDSLKTQLAQNAKAVEEAKENQKKNEEALKKQEEINRQAGNEDKALVKTWVDKYRTHDRMKYYQSFYWTLLNYIDSYRVASTGVVQRNEDYGKNTKLEGGVNIAGKVLDKITDLAEGLPMVGSVIGILKGAMQAIYGAYKEKKLDDKINSLNKVVTENKSATSLEMLSLQIQLAAMRIADKKDEEIQRLIEYSKIPKEKSTLNRAVDYLTEKFEEAKAKLAGPEIKLYDSVPASEGLKDAMATVAYLELNYQQVIDLSLEVSLDKQIYMMVADRQAMKILESIQMPVTQVVSQEQVQQNVRPVIQEVRAVNQAPQQIQQQPQEQQQNNQQQQYNPPQQTSAPPQQTSVPPQQPQQTSAPPQQISAPPPQQPPPQAKQENNSQTRQENQSNQNTSNPQSQQQPKQQQEQQKPLSQPQKTEETRDSSCCILQ